MLILSTESWRASAEFSGGIAAWADGERELTAIARMLSNETTKHLANGEDVDARVQEGEALHGRITLGDPVHVEHFEVQPE